MVKNMAERMAINMPIQGAAADIMKIAMLKVDRWVDEYNNKNEDISGVHSKECRNSENKVNSYRLKPELRNVKLLLQVHDELLFSIKEDNISEATMEIKEIMENCHLNLDGKEIDFSVPIVVDVKVGDNWEEMSVI